MQELQALDREIRSLRREVRGQRRSQRRSLFVAVVAVLIAAISPFAALAANFRDLNPGSVHNANINAIADAGITTGCTPGVEYCPNANVTREEMASFLARTAGVGNNPPVTNARTVQGFTANGLVRANGGGQGNNPVFVGFSYSPVAQVSISAPGPGFVYISGAVTVYAYTASNAIVSAVIIDQATQLGSFPQGATIGTTSGSTSFSTISPTIVFPVPGAGVRTYQLVLAKDNLASGSTAANAATLSAVFVPFGPGGATGADITPTWTPLGEPLSRPQP